MPLARDRRGIWPELLADLSEAGVLSLASGQSGDTGRGCWRHGACAPRWRAGGLERGSGARAAGRSAGHVPDAGSWLWHYMRCGESFDLACRTAPRGGVCGSDRALYPSTDGAARTLVAMDRRCAHGMCCQHRLPWDFWYPSAISLLLRLVR